MTEEQTREHQLNDALLITNLFLMEICEQLDVDPETSIEITLNRKEGSSVVTEFTLEECLSKNKELLVRARP